MVGEKAAQRLMEPGILGVVRDQFLDAAEVVGAIDDHPCERAEGLLLLRFPIGGCVIDIVSSLLPGAERGGHGARHLALWRRGNKPLGGSPGHRILDDKGWDGII